MDITFDAAGELAIALPAFVSLWVSFSCRMNFSINGTKYNTLSGGKSYSFRTSLMRVSSQQKST